VACSSVDGVDGTEDAHLQIDGRLLHEGSPNTRGLPSTGRLQQEVVSFTTTSCVAGHFCDFC
jgi:hypothetical protein